MRERHWKERAWKRQGFSKLGHSFCSLKDIIDLQLMDKISQGRGGHPYAKHMGDAKHTLDIILIIYRNMLLNWYKIQS